MASPLYLVFANGFATSRAQSMKSCATGLSVLFFKVTNSDRSQSRLNGQLSRARRDGRYGDGGGL